MNAIIDKTYKTEAGIEKAIARITAKHGEENIAVEQTPENGAIRLVITRIESNEPEGEVLLPRDDDGNIIIDETPEEREAAETALAEAAAPPKIEYPITCSIQRRHVEQMVAAKKTVKRSRKRSNGILPVFNCPAFAEDHEKYRGPNVRATSKVGIIVAMGAGNGFRASDIINAGIFVRRNGNAWDRASIDCVFRWDTPAKGYSVQTVEAPDGIDHVYVVRARGLEVNDLSAIAEHWFGDADSSEESEAA